MISAKRLMPVALLAVVALAIAWLIRPVFHPFVMFFYTSPLVWLPPVVVLVVGLVAAGLVMRRGPGGNATLRDPMQGGVWVVGEGGLQRYNGLPAGIRVLAIAGVVAFITFVVAGALSGPLTAQALYRDHKFASVPELPASGAIRLVPQEVAVEIASSGFNSATESLTEFHIVRDTGGLSWTALRTPDGAYRALTQKSRGLLALNASKSERTVKSANADFEAAPGMYVTDNLRWRLLKKHFLIDIPETTAIVGDDGKPLIIAPYISYKGLLVRRPKLGGVFVAHPDGRIEDLTPEQARARPEILRSGRIVPSSLARRIHDSYAYKKGLWNKWFLHEEQTQVTDTELNPQPYLLDFGKLGVKWVTVAEPFGRAFAVNSVFLTDSVTGKTELWQPPRDASLTGNRRALETVRSLSIPGIVFTDTRSNSAGGRGGFRVVEPRPVFVRGRLMFMISIIPDAANSVSKTVFVDSARNKVAAIFDSDTDQFAEQKIERFIATGEGARFDGLGGTPADSSGSSDSSANDQSSASDGTTPGSDAAPKASGKDSTGGSDKQSGQALKRKLDRLIERQRGVLRDAEDLRDSLR